MWNVTIVRCINTIYNIINRNQSSINILKLEINGIRDNDKRISTKPILLTEKNWLILKLWKKIIIDFKYTLD